MNDELRYEGCWVCFGDEDVTALAAEVVSDNTTKNDTDSDDDNSNHMGKMIIGSNVRSPFRT